MSLTWTYFVYSRRRIGSVLASYEKCVAPLRNCPSRWSNSIRTLKSLAFGLLCRVLKWHHRRLDYAPMLRGWIFFPSSRKPMYTSTRHLVAQFNGADAGRMIRKNVNCCQISHTCSARPERICLGTITKVPTGIASRAAQAKKAVEADCDKT